MTIAIEQFKGIYIYLEIILIIKLLFEIGLVNPMLNKNFDIWIQIGYMSCGMGWNLSQSNLR